jgi:hypothetical protein
MGREHSICTVDHYDTYMCLNIAFQLV